MVCSMVKFYFLWSFVNVIINSSKDRPHSALYKIIIGAKGFLLDSWALKMGPKGCPETSVINYHYSLRNNPEERSSHNITYLEVLNNWNTSLERISADPLQNLHQDTGSMEHILRATTQETIRIEWLALTLTILGNTCLILIWGDGYLDPVPSCFLCSSEKMKEWL
jgi:hypothetical protein